MSLSLAGSGEISGFDAGLSGFGGLVVVKSALFTGTQTNSAAGGANFAVTDLSITHEVADASNKLVISAFIGVGANGQNFGNIGLAVHDGTSLINIGDAAGNRTSISAGGISGADVFSQTTNSPSVTFVYTPGTGSKTYTVRAVNLAASTQTVYVNRTESDVDQVQIPRGVSSLVIQEVKV